MSASLRAITAAKSTVTSPVCTPCRSAVRARWATRADARNALVGPAASVEARAADLVLLDERDPLPVGDEVARHAGAGLAGADHDRVELLVVISVRHGPIVMVRHEPIVSNR